MGNATTTKMGNAIFGRTQVQPSQLMLKDSEIVFSQNDKTLQETFSEKLCSTVEYASVFNGVNVHYDLNSNSLKESVIIASAPTGRTGYQYLLEAKNLVLELQEDNSIYAYATDHAEGDDPVFFMPAPYLFDQEKVYCDDIELMFVAPTLNSFCIQMIGEAEKNKQISQTITVSGRTGDVFSVAGWAMAHSAPVVENSNRRFAIRARFDYTDGTTDSTLVAFNPSTGDYSTWQYVADRIVAKKAYKSITISLLYSYNVNEVYFDGIQLFKEEFGHSYAYDSNGNVTSVTDLQKKTITYEYSSNNLTKMTLPSGASQTYTYDNYHNVLSAISSASGTEYTFTYGAFDLVNSVKIGSRALISHTYSNDANRWLTRSDYGNGDYITYSYDLYGRTSAIGYEDNAEAVKYTYDNNGNLGIVDDNVCGRKTKYLYDFQDRLMGYEENSVDHSNIVQWGYDDKNNLSSQTQTLNGTSYTTNYSYDNDNRLKQATTGGKSANYTYDVYSRMTGITAKRGSSTVVSTGITYKNPTSATTSTQVYKWTVGGTTYTYTYDARGNITAISDGTNTTSYVYDSLDQLTRENNQAAGKTWVYTYDNGGNILRKSEYAYTTGTLGAALDTISYGYGDSSWKDLLTSYDGKQLSSDAIGNLSGDGKWSYSWRRGRVLWDMSRMVDEDAELFEVVQYRYDSNGRRTGKSYGDSYNFRIVGGQLYYVGDSTGTAYYYAGDDLSQIDITFPDNSSTSLHFTYDELGPMSVTYDGAEYFYLKNAQGDVTGLVNSSGTQVVAYTYDAWGNPLTTTGSMADTLGKLNPFRYRGYVYDTETGLYYLGSRYYNPTWGRFVNADNQIAGIGSNPGGYNVFAYCANNPTNMSDPAGNWPKWATKLATAIAIVAAVAVVAAITVATAGAGTAIAAVAVGAAKGSAIGLAIGAATGAAGGAIKHRITTGSWKGSGGAILNGMANGALSGAVSGAITGGIAGGLSYNSGAASTGKGFDSYRQLKKEIGSPGAGNEWHHIVEQCQIAKSGFSPQLVQNTSNIMSIGKSTHRAISGYYSSVQPFTDGLTVRNWLVGQSFSAQHEFGLNVIKMFM